MRLLILTYLTTLLTSCVTHPMASERSEAPYRPSPTVALSTFGVGERIVSVYIRHSEGSLLLHLAPIETDHGLADSGLKMVMPMQSPQNVQFAPARYENFTESVDVFQDGRIILVPLTDADGEAVGVFVNLLSGKRFFFAPSMTSQDAQARIKWLNNRWPDITVVIPEDRRAHERVARFPEFLQ